MEDDRRTTTELLIDHANRAGSLLIAARKFPEARAGMEAAARWHDAKVTDLAEQICTQAEGLNPPTWVQP